LLWIPARAVFLSLLASAMLAAMLFAPSRALARAAADPLCRCNVSAADLGAASWSTADTLWLEDSSSLVDGGSAPLGLGGPDADPSGSDDPRLDGERAAPPPGCPGRPAHCLPAARAELVAAVQARGCVGAVGALLLLGVAFGRHRRRVYASTVRTHGGLKGPGALASCVVHSCCCTHACALCQEARVAKRAYGAYGEVLHAPLPGDALQVPIFEVAERRGRASGARMCALAATLTVLASAAVCGREQVAGWGRGQGVDWPCLGFCCRGSH
jgi:hypothetical protein